MATANTSIIKLLRIPSLSNTRIRGTDARVPTVPDARGMSPLPNHVARTRAIFSEKTDSLNMSG
jgi:hypothetical protein